MSQCVPVAPCPVTIFGVAFVSIALSTSRLFADFIPINLLLLRGDAGQQEAPGESSAGAELCCEGTKSEPRLVGVGQRLCLGGAAETLGSWALETAFESLINWIITQAIEFPSGQICPSLPDRAPQLVHEMACGTGSGWRQGGAELFSCPHPSAFAPASLPSLWGVNLAMEPKQN